MQKKVLLLILCAALILIGGLAILQLKHLHQQDVLEITPRQQIIAVFDTADGTIKKEKINALYYTLKWTNHHDGTIPAKKLTELFSKQLPLFINLQIWPSQIISRLQTNIAADINDGSYDEKLGIFFRLLHNANTPVYLSYNAEMEVPSYQYPWQAGSFSQYINSFRHIYTLCKKYAPHIKIVWGPSGYPGAEEYWPGDEYVDAISLKLTMDREVKKDDYPGYPDVAEMVKRKLFRVRFMKKPVLLLSTTSVVAGQFEQSLGKINNIIAANKSIFLTPVIAAEHDTASSCNYDSVHLQLGVYDPKLLLVKEPLITTEHIFTDMNGVMNGSFKAQFESIIKRHHHAIVTMEPWRLGKQDKDSLILEHTLDGTYDKVWSTLYQQISNVPQTVYLRWGHEMEIPVDRYAWQRKDPIAYIKAFRYFANFQQPRAFNIKIVWGPAGDRGSIDWWPGEDVVDLVSIAIYGLPDKNINDYNKQNSFTNILRLKLYRMRFTHKPIFITEFGVKGPEEYQKKWMDDAAATLNKYPEVAGVSYFNFADVPKAWGKAETPVWSISEATFKSFTSKLVNVPH